MLLSAILSPVIGALVADIVLMLFFPNAGLGAARVLILGVLISMITFPFSYLAFTKNCEQGRDRNNVPENLRDTRANKCLVAFDCFQSDVVVITLF